MRIFKKHEKNQESFEEGIYLLSRSFLQMKIYLYKILRMIKQSRDVERKIENILREFAKSKAGFDKTHLLRDFYDKISKAKNAQGEARNILLHYRLKENHHIIEQAFHKFKESYKYTSEAKRILKNMAKKSNL